MRKYVIMGVQGSGKGTQSQLLAADLDLVHIGVGDIFRWNVQNHTKLGAQVRRTMATGELVGDDLVESVVRDRLTQHDWNFGFIIDGFPRNRRQAEFFLESYDIDGVIVLDLPDSEVRRRVLNRRLCADCGMDYHLIDSSPKVPGQCDSCGGELVTREDDTEEALAVRLRDYHEKTDPVIELFRRKEYVFTVDARSAPEAVQEQIRTCLGVSPDDRAQVTATGCRRCVRSRYSAAPRIRELTAEICAHLRVPQRPVLLKRFANDCLEVQLQSNCRERDVFIIQSLVRPVQEHLVELLLMADAARGASAARVNAVIPHYAYARSDKKDAPRISIGGRLVADLLVTAGVDRVLTLNLHSPQVHGFFSVPVDHLHALRELAAHFRQRDLSNAVVVSPDLGYAKSAAAFARRLGLPVAAGAKERMSDTEVRITAIIGDVTGRDVIVLDDEISRGTTVFELLDRLREQGARSVAVACTHGLFADNALDKLAAADVTEIVCTNSAPLEAEHSKLTVLSVAPALAEAISRIHNGESVSSLFDH